MLKSQALYGPHGAAKLTRGGAAIGRTLFRSVPEDVHDRGPITGGEGSLALVADIRIDNRDEIVADLQISPETAGHLSDAALLMQALERWEEGTLERLVGDFAFALWDSRRERLLLARDFLGQRPLHLHQGKDFVAFSSMPKGLHALPEIPRAPNDMSVLEFLALRPDSPRGTFFAGIEKVEPGHVVSIDRSGSTHRRYWNPRPKLLRLNNPAEYEQALREKLDTAVSARLRGAERRVAAHLSAGLDSSAVAATAARLMAGHGGEVLAFTSVPRKGFVPKGLDGVIWDEGPLANATADLHGNMRHFRVSSGGGSPLDSLDRNFFLYERPVPNICNGLWWDGINDEVKRNGLQVLLTGTMGNLSFSYGGMELLSELLGSGRLIALLRTSLSLRRNGAEAISIAAHAAGPFLPISVWKGLRRIGGRASGIADYTFLKPSMLEAAFEEDRHDNRPHANGIAARLQTLRRADPGNYNKGTLGGWKIDVRDPTADRRLVEFCLSVPLEQYLLNGVPRSLARRAFSDRLPAALLNERRKGYQAADWHEALRTSPTRVRDEIASIANCLRAATLLDTQTMLEVVERWPSGDFNEKRFRQRYRVALLRAVSAGHFLRAATGSNR